MRLKKIASFSIAIMLLLSSLTIPSFAQTQGVFSLQPTGEDLKILNSQPKQPEPEAWIITPDGKKSSTEVISKDELKGLVEHTDDSNLGVIRPQFTEDYGTYVYSYVWDGYVQNYSTTDRYKFFQGSCSIENRTGSPITLKYIQGETKSTTWTVTGKVEFEAEFKVAMLAKLKATAGVTVADSWTTQASSTIETTMTVRSGYIGTLSRYKQGAYSSGAGSWKKYRFEKATQYTTYVGEYYETGTAWGICQNIDNYKAVES